MKSCFMRCVAGVFAAFWLASSAFAQASKAPEFPQDPAQWIHGRPISVENLKGKAVFLWYFEEQCPTCRGKWPAILAMAKKYEGQPILFIAVNSGTPRKDIEQYVRETGVTWPVLVDTSREYEKASGIVPEISLKNIHQLKIIAADGRMQFGDWSDMDGTVASALKTATWKVDPKGIPTGLNVAWQEIEFGNYAAAGATVKKALTAPQADLKQAAEKLKSVVQVEIDAMLKAAKDADEKGSAWEAYKLYGEMGPRFAGFDLPSEVDAAKKRLASDPKIKAGQVAQRDLDAAKKLLSTASAGSHKKASLMLEKIAKDSPDSDAGKEAQAILTQLAQPAGK